MSILIILRKKVQPNRFHSLIIKSLQTAAGDNALLCSGFFQEDAGYSASIDSGLCCALNISRTKLMTIGIHNGLWLNKYRKFRTNIRRCGNHIDAFIARRLHWHAKVYILKSGGDPIMGIIGSSNMTRSAFHVTSPFNFESDVILWDKNVVRINSLCEEEMTNDDDDGIIYADYNLERNNNRTAMDKLRRLEAEILSQELTELE